MVAMGTPSRNPRRSSVFVQSLLHPNDRTMCDGSAGRGDPGVDTRRPSRADARFWESRAPQCPIGHMSTIDELYQATILDHDRAPRNQGTLSGATHSATIDNPLCGDVVTVQAEIADGVIRAIAFDGRGCALSRAAASIMTTMVHGAAPDEARRLAAAFEQFVQSAPDSAV